MQKRLPRRERTSVSTSASVREESECDEGVDENHVSAMSACLVRSWQAYSDGSEIVLILRGPRLPWWGCPCRMKAKHNAGAV
jgi:hypothetical protein